MANSLSISDDQTEIENFQFDSIRTDVGNIRSSVNDLSSSVDSLNNNIQQYQTTLSKIGNTLSYSAKQIGGVGMQMARNANREFGPDVKGAGFERSMTSIAGPLGIAVAKSIQDTGIGDAIKGIGNKVMSMFGRSRQDSGMIDASQIRSLAAGSASEAKAVVSSVNNLNTPITQLAAYQKESNDIAKQQLQSNKREQQQTENFQQAILPMLSPLNKTLVDINESITQLNNAFTDPAAPKGGLLATFWGIGKMMMGLRFITSTRYGGDIPKSKNPLETISNALIKTYEWTRLYGDLSRRQLNELIKYPSGGGRPQKVVGAESVMTALLRKGTLRLKDAISSSLGEDSFLGKNLNRLVGLASNFMIGETEEAKDAEYAKAMSKWNSFFDDRSSDSLWKKIQKAGESTRKKYSAGDDESSVAMDNMAAGYTQKEIDFKAEEVSKETASKLVSVLKEDAELKKLIAEATNNISDLKSVVESDQENEENTKNYQEAVNKWQKKITDAIQLIAEQNDLSSHGIDIKSIEDVVLKQESMFTTLWNLKSTDPLNDDSVPKMADGGIVNKATNAVVGEAGPEAIIPIDKLLNTIIEGSKTIAESVKKSISDSIAKGMQSVSEDSNFTATMLSAAIKDTITTATNGVKEKLSNISETVSETLELNKESNVMQQESLSIEIARETDRLYEKIKNAGNKVKKVGKNIFDTILHNPMISSLAVCLGILAKFPAIAEWVFSSPSTFLKAIQMWHKIKTLMTSLFKTLLKDPSKVFGAIKKGLGLYVKGLQKITKGLMKLPGLLIKGYSKLLKGIQSLPGKIKTLFGARSKIMKDLTNSVKGGLTKSLNSVKKVWSGGFGKFFKDLAKMTKDVGLKVAKSFKSMSVNFGRFMVDLAKDFSKIASQAIQKGKTIFVGLKDLFKKVPNLLVAWQKYLKNAPSLGHKIVSGIATINVGFKHMVSGIKNIGKTTKVASDASKQLSAIPKIANALKHPINTLSGVGKLAPKIINAIKHPISAVTGIAKFVGSTFKSLGSIAKGSKAAGSIAKLGAGAGAKMGAKGAFKKIPGIGSIISILFAINRFRKGQWFTGSLEFGSAIASMFPVYGTAISLAIDAVTMMSDMVRDADVSTPEKVAEIKAGAGKGWLRNLPGIGTIVGIYDALRLFKAKQWGSGFYHAGRAIATIVPAGGYIFDGISSLVQMITEAGLGTKTEKGESQFGVGGAFIRQIPIIGSVFSIMSAIKRFKNGEIFTGILETASGISSLFPGVGTIISSVLTGLTFFIDRVSNESDVLTAEDVQKENQSIKDGMSKGWLRNVPIIGPVMNLWDAIRLFKNGEVLGGLKGVGRAVAGIIPGGGWMFDKVASFAEWFFGSDATEGGENGLELMGKEPSDLTFLDRVKLMWDGGRKIISSQDAESAMGVKMWKQAGLPDWMGRWMWRITHPIAAITSGFSNIEKLANQDTTELKDTITETARKVKEGKDLLWDGDENKQGLGIAKLRQAGWADWKIKTLWALYHPLAAITGGWGDAAEKAPNLNNMSNEDVSKYEDAITKKAEVINKGMSLLKSKDDSEQSRGIYMLQKQGYSKEQVEGMWKWYHPVDYVWGKIKGWFGKGSKFDTLWNNSFNEAVKHYNKETAKAIAEDRADKLQMIAVESAKIQASRFAEIDVKNKNLQERLKDVSKAKIWMQSNNINDQAKAVGMLRRAKWSFNDIKQLWLSYHPELDAMGEITPSGLKRWDEVYKLSDIHAQNKKKRKKNVIETIYKAKKLFSEGGESKARQAIALLKQVGVSDDNIQKIYENIDPNAATSAQFKSMLLEEQLSKTRTRSGTFDIKTKKDEHGNVTSYTIGDQTYSANSEQGQQIKKIAEAQNASMAKSLDSRRDDIKKNISNSLQLKASATVGGQTQEIVKQGVNFANIDKDWLKDLSSLVGQLGGGKDKEIRQKIAEMTGGVQWTYGEGPFNGMPSNHVMMALLDQPAGHGTSVEDNKALEASTGIKSLMVDRSSSAAQQIAKNLLDPKKSPIAQIPTITQSYAAATERLGEGWGDSNSAWGYIKSGLESGMTEYAINKVKNGEKANTYAINPKMMADIHSETSSVADTAAFGHLSKSQQKAYKETFTTKDSKGNTVTKTASDLYKEDSKAAEKSNDPKRQYAAQQSLISTLTPDIENYIKRSGGEPSNAITIAEKLANTNSSSNHFLELAGYITEAEAENIVKKIKSIYTRGSTALWSPSHWDKAIASKYEDSINGIFDWGTKLQEAKENGKFDESAQKSITENSNTIKRKQALKVSGEATQKELRTGDRAAKIRKENSDISSAAKKINKSGIKENSNVSSIDEEIDGSGSDKILNRKPDQLVYDEYGNITLSATEINNELKKHSKNGMAVNTEGVIGSILGKCPEFKKLDLEDKREAIYRIANKYRTGKLLGQKPIDVNKNIKSQIRSDIAKSLDDSPQPKHIEPNLVESTKNTQQDTVQTSAKNDVAEQSAGNREISKSVKEASNKQVNAISRSSYSTSNTNNNSTTNNTTIHQPPQDVFYMRTIGTDANSI